MESEYSLLRVPYEQLSRVFKNTTRAIEKEIQQVVGAIAGLSKKKDVKKEEAFTTFTKLSAKLQSLKKKVCNACNSSLIELIIFFNLNPA